MTASTDNGNGTLRFTVTVFADYAANVCYARDLTLEELAGYIRKTSAPNKDSLPWLKLAVFGDTPNLNTGSGCLRWNGNVREIAGIVVDYDGERMSLDEALLRMSEASITTLIYTSPSHTDAAPRWRICCPCSKKTDPDLHYQLVARVNGILGGILAEESFALSQSYYFGSVEGKPEPRVEIVYGARCIDECEALDGGAIGKPNGRGNGRQQAPGKPEASIEKIIDALALIPNDDLDWDEWNRIGMATWRACGGSEEGWQAFDSWSQKSRKYDAEETWFRWNHFHRSPPNKIGFGTLRYEAREAEIAWLAGLSQREYEAEREAAARRLGYRVSELDRIVARWGQRSSFAHRGQRDPENGAEGDTRTAKACEQDDKETATRIASCIDRYNQSFAVVHAGNRVAILREYFAEHGHHTFALMGVDSFRLWKANDFVEVPDGNGGTKQMVAADLWLRSPRRQEYNGIVFRPVPSTPGYYNLWRGFAVEPRSDGSCERFKAHLLDNVCRGSEELFEWVFGWFADVVQHPDQKCGTSIVLRGDEGVGKTVIAKTIIHLLGIHGFLATDPRYVVHRFNAHLESVLLFCADEAFWAGNKEAEGFIKGLITGDTMQVERKGFEPFTVGNYIRLLVLGNDEWLVPAGMDARRWLVLDVGNDHKEDHRYFAEMDAELKGGGYERLLHELMSFDLWQINLRQAPRTEALLAQKLASLSPEAAWWLAILQRGYLPHGLSEELPANQCISDFLYDDYVAHTQKVMGTRRKQIQTQLGIFLKRMIESDRPGVVGPRLRRVQLKRTYAGKPRPMTYIFPSLEACRKGFEARMQQLIPWEGPGEWQLAGDDDVDLGLDEVLQRS